MNHPDFQTLFRYRAGELTGKFQAMVGAHLDRCPHCRLQLDGSEPPAPAPPRPAPDLLNGIRQAIRKFDAGRSSPERSGEALKNRVAQEIGPFLGEQAARQLLLRVSESGHNLLGTLEPVLSNFLGERAAAQLVSHVVDAAIVGNNS